MSDWPSHEVVGVYAIDAPEPVHLVEVTVYADAFSVGEITQPDPRQPRENWQVAYDAKVLDDVGERVVADTWDLPEPDVVPEGKTRLTFFFHYLEPSRPLSTPFGEVRLPEPSPLPARLSEIKYEEP